MFLIGKKFSILIFQACIAVYLIYSINEIRLDTEDSIYRQWSDRGKQSYSQYWSRSWLNNVFKKMGVIKGSNNFIVVDHFVDFVSEYVFLINTFWLMLALSTFIYLIMITSA